MSLGDVREWYGGISLIELKHDDDNTDDDRDDDDGDDEDDVDDI